MKFYELFVGFRFTMTGRHDRFVSFVSVLSMAGIALGVAALLTVLAVMSGFQTQLRERIVILLFRRRLGKPLPGQA